MLFAFLVAMRDYLKVVASEDHTSQEIFNGSSGLDGHVDFLIVLARLLSLDSFPN